MHGLSRWRVASGWKEEDTRAGQESLTVGSWRPTISEVHGLALHGQAVRSIFVSTDSRRLALRGSILVMWIWSEVTGEW